MSALHTPWIAHEYGSPKGHWFVRDSNGETINYPLAEREALLFAAAPTMLDALEAVDRMFSEPGKFNKNSVRDQVRAAIAKATVQS